MKTSMQLKALTRNLAKEKNISHEVLLRNFMLERFLERISVSKYKNKFILKGGMLVASIVGMDTRSTMDLDATLKDQTLNEKEIEKIINEILPLDIGDNVLMALKNIEQIREEAEYTGTRLAIESILDKTKQVLKIDLTTGDSIIPKEIDYDYKLMFENRTIPIKAYTLETVLAEKLETILKRGLTNTRMRDFYDVYILTKLHSNEIDSSILKTAIKTVFEERGSAELLNDKFKILETIKQDKTMQNMWNAYIKTQNTNFSDDKILWLDVMVEVKKQFGGG